MDPEIEDELNTTDEAPLSLRDSLAQSFEAHAEEPGETEPTEPPPAEPLEGETQAQADARARDEATGRYTKAPKKTEKPAVTVKPVVKPAAKAPVAVKPAVVAKPGVQQVVKGVPTSAQQPAAVEVKAPQSFRGPAKEEWAKVPESVKVEVLRREKEFATALQTVGEERKYAGTMKAAFAPFEAQIRAEGSTPEAAIGKLMNTAMLFRTGPPHLKAAALADMIHTYGVPLEGLVAALQGRQAPPGQQGQQQQQPQHVDPAAIAAQVREDLMKELGSQRDTQLLAKSEASITAFLEKQPMHGLDLVDYSKDIRETMADLIDAANNRGSTITLEKAYTLAARAHPEVSKVLERQEQAAKATKANASTSRARVAASSVRNSPSTQPVSTGKGSSLREAINAAAEQHDG